MFASVLAFPSGESGQPRLSDVCAIKAGRCSTNKVAVRCRCSRTTPCPKVNMCSQDRHSPYHKVLKNDWIHTWDWSKCMCELILLNAILQRQTRGAWVRGDSHFQWLHDMILHHNIPSQTAGELKSKCSGSFQQSPAQLVWERLDFHPSCLLWHQWDSWWLHV